mgnify:CR=1 FL=1
MGRKGARAGRRAGGEGLGALPDSAAEDVAALLTTDRDSDVAKAPRPPARAGVARHFDSVG